MSDKVRASPLPGGPTLTRSLELVSVSYDLEKLMIRLEDSENEVSIGVAFPDVEAYRVMDEGRLLAYWPECSPNAAVFEIHSGGWLDELRRGTNGLLWDSKTLREFLVPGINDCASVLSFSVPELVA